MNLFLYASSRLSSEDYAVSVVIRIILHFLSLFDGNSSLGVNDSPGHNRQYCRKAILENKRYDLLLEVTLMILCTLSCLRCPKDYFFMHSVAIGRNSEE